MKHFLRSLPAALLILLFVYAAASKLTSFAIFRIQLNRQTIPHGIAAILVYVIPAAELAAVALLFFQRTALKGLYLALSLLSVFSLYIALVVLHFWSRVPCPCGGILNHMSWTVHLVFNLLFIVVNLIAIHIQLRERRGRDIPVKAFTRKTRAGRSPVKPVKSFLLNSLIFIIMKKFKINIAVIAILLGAGLAFGQSAFTTVKKDAKHSGTEYQFNGTEASQEKTASEYSVVSGSGPSCSGTALVCTINVSGDLQTWLNDHTTQEILDAADQTRN